VTPVARRSTRRTSDELADLDLISGSNMSVLDGLDLQGLQQVADQVRPS